MPRLGGAAVAAPSRAHYRQPPNSPCAPRAPALPSLTRALHAVRHSSVRAHSEVPGEGVAATQLYRPGFFLADGAGVGKGRQIAALIAEHWRTGGRRVLWLSVSTDLQVGCRKAATAAVTALTWSWPALCI